MIPTLDAQIANRNRCDFRSQSSSEIGTKIATKSVENRVEIATEIAMIRIAAISNRKFEIASALGIYTIPNLGTQIAQCGAILRPYPQCGWDFLEEVPERLRKRSQSVSWNSPREYG